MIPDWDLGIGTVRSGEPGKRLRPAAQGAAGAWGISKLSKGVGRAGLSCRYVVRSAVRPRRTYPQETAMTIWSTPQWKLLRQELAVALLAAGLVANVAWITLGSWTAVIELGNLLVFVAHRFR